MARLELTLNFPKGFQVKTFNIKSEKKLSPLARLILQSVQFKHFYYVRDDISYLLKSTPIERDFLLQTLYSIVISLQNNLSVNFFDMWVYEIYINKISNYNKFIDQKSQKVQPSEYITIKLAYATNVSSEKNNIQL
uniref:Uncharacterized protein n=1 Tax=Roundia cardiophora TaxID=1403802 RepID=A0A089VI06_9STRA|nr:hypothetical protein Ycf88 [Roundia cardiophora]AIR75906.1 hypothetical protein Ycf88 [Roundia cardiophora]